MLSCTDAIVVCSGPSLTEEDARYVASLAAQGRCTAIAVNDAYRLVRSPDILYACDHAWWRYHCQRYTRLGEPAILSICPDAQRYTGEPMAASEFGCKLVELRVGRGIDASLTGVMRGYGSGFQAVGLAVLLGARRIALLGADCMRAADGRSHWFGEHPRELPNPQPFDLWVEDFDSLAEPAQRMGIEIVNCSRASAIRRLPRMELHEWARSLA